MYKINKNCLFTLIATLFVGSLLSACGANIYAVHPELAQIQEDSAIAKVYFIRPQMEKNKGLADKTLSVRYKNNPLFTIDEGQYILVPLKPGKGIVSTHSITKFINRDQPISVSRQREYTFLAGGTYFIHLKRIDEEFRGIFYDPEPIDWEDAVRLTRDARPRGAARDARIASVSEAATNVPVPASRLEPAMPEQIYPQQTYMLEIPVEPIILEEDEQCGQGASTSKRQRFCEEPEDE